MILQMQQLKAKMHGCGTTCRQFCNVLLNGYNRYDGYIYIYLLYKYIYLVLLREVDLTDSHSQLRQGISKTVNIETHVLGCFWMFWGV